MLRKASLVVLLLVATVLACAQSKKAQPKEGPEAPYLKVIEAKCKELAQLGHVPKQFDCAYIIGRYAWHGDAHGYFGTYEFYQPAFEQAKRSWYFHGKVIENSDELWVEDTYNGDGIRFDDSVIGRTIGPMYMARMSNNGDVIGEQFTAKVVGVIDNGRLKLDKRAPHHAEQWNLAILPDDYVDFCACHEGGPQFVNGQPVLEKP